MTSPPDLEDFLSALDVYDDAVLSAIEARNQRMIRSAEGRDTELMTQALAAADAARLAREALIEVVRHRRR